VLRQSAEEVAAAALRESLLAAAAVLVRPQVLVDRTPLPQSQ
jgi:hypothetical protein